jgi:SAM-dependent methyltransferase
MIRLVGAGVTTESLRELLDVESLPVIEEVSPRDGMYLYAPDLYAEAGQTALRMIRLAMLAAGIERAGRVLDFASGAGRVLRYLKAGFPDADITACDVTQDDVEYCVQTFGVRGIVSDPDPSRIELDGRYDVIWCGSLLTHVDDVLWVRFVQVMERALAPGGVMVFTVYGARLAAGLRSGENLLGLTTEQAALAVRGYDATGFGFAAADDRPEEGFGDCIASPAWVTTTLREATPALELVLHARNAWIGQDVVACTKS